MQSRIVCRKLVAWLKFFSNLCQVWLIPLFSYLCSLFVLPTCGKCMAIKVLQDNALLRRHWWWHCPQGSMFFSHITASSMIRPQIGLNDLIKVCSVTRLAPSPTQNWSILRITWEKSWNFQNTGVFLVSKYFMLWKYRYVCWLQIIEMPCCSIWVNIPKTKDV